MLGTNFMNGFFNDPLGAILDGINHVLDLNIMQPIKTLIGEIFKAAYMLWAAAASLIDCIQVIFGMLVGTVSVKWQNGSGMGQMVDINGNTMTQGLSTNNMILDVFLSEYVLGAFWKLLILSIFLLLIFTIIAIIKNEYSTSPDGGDSKKPETTNNKMFIIKRAVRSLIGFLCVPLACMFGIIASGYLMQALDAATSITGEKLLSNKMFELCASDANRVRTDVDFYIKLSNSTDKPGTENLEDYEISNGYTIFPDFQGKQQEDLANIIDEYFIYAKELPQGVTFSESDSFNNFSNKSIFWISGNGMGMNDDHYFNTKNSAQVFYYYDLTKFEWLIGIATIFWMLVLMVKLSLGAAVRLYELAVLFIVSPAIISLAPLDGGEALKTWQKKFIGKVTMVFAPVIALNLYFILVATLMQVDFTSSISFALTGGGPVFTGTTAAAIQQVYNIMIAIAGLMVCESAMKLLGELIGADDMMKAGNDLQGKLASAVTTSAAGKYLLSKGSAVKGGMANLGAAAGGKVKGALSNFKGDHRDADVTRSAQLQKEAEFQGKMAERKQEMTDFNAKDRSGERNSGYKGLRSAGVTPQQMSNATIDAMKNAGAELDKIKQSKPDLSAEEQLAELGNVLGNQAANGDAALAKHYSDYFMKDLVDEVGKSRDNDDIALQQAHELDIRNTKYDVRKMSDQEKKDVLSKGRQMRDEGDLTDEVIRSVYVENGTMILNPVTRAGLNRRGAVLNARSRVRRSSPYNRLKSTWKGQQYDPSKRNDSNKGDGDKK